MRRRVPKPLRVPTPRLGALLGVLLGAVLVPACGEERARGSTDETAFAKLATTMEIAGCEVHVVTVGPQSGPDVLLLHGAAFHVGTWDDLGTLDVLGAAGFHVVAMDLPGFGRSPPADVDRNSFLAEALSALELERPVVVSPSMSGRFAFPLIARHPDRVAGWVPVAPAGIDEYVDSVKNSPVAVLCVWGTDDTVIPVREAERLVEAFPNSAVLLLDGARHPAYLDDPDGFHLRLIEFVRKVQN